MEYGNMFYSDYKRDNNNLTNLRKDSGGQYSPLDEFGFSFLSISVP
jgi:hypothetical protein